MWVVRKFSYSARREDEGKRISDSGRQIGGLQPDYGTREGGRACRPVPRQSASGGRPQFDSTSPETIFDVRR